ncbi:MAG: hypothetical protein ACKVHO_17875 [Verrucomicrobiia bacterium]
MSGIYGLVKLVFRAIECFVGLGKYAWSFVRALLRSRAGAAVRIVALESQLDECQRAREGKRIGRFTDSFKLLWVLLSKWWEGWDRACHAYRSSISTDILTHDKYAFRAYLIKVANHRSKDTLAIQFVDYSKLSDEQKRDVDRVAGIVKEKQVSVINSDLLRPSDVVKQVQEKLGNPKVKRYANSNKANYKVQDRFTSNGHVSMWRKFRVRPPYGSKRPKDTNKDYCHYDNLIRAYGYTPKWVDKCVEFIRDNDSYLYLYNNPDVIEIIKETQQ